MGKSCDWYLKGASRFMNGVFAYSYQQVDFKQPFSNFVSRAPFENSTMAPPICGFRFSRVVQQRRYHRDDVA